MESRRTLKGVATSGTFLTTKKLIIILGRHTLYIICIFLLSGCFFYYLWVMFTALNLRFRENRKKKNKILLLLLLLLLLLVLLLLIIIKKNCRNLAALRRSLSFFEADDLILIGGGRLGLGNKFVEALPVTLIFFVLMFLVQM